MKPQISVLSVLIILFPLTSAEAEKLFRQLKTVKTELFAQMSQEFLNTLQIRHDSYSFGKIKGTAVNKWTNTK